MSKLFRTFGWHCAAAGAGLASVLVLGQAGLSQDQKESPAPAARAKTEPAKESVDNTRGKAKAEAREAKGEARDAKGDAREAGRDSRESAREGKQDARETGREGRQDAREGGRDGRQDAREDGREGRQGARDGRQDAREGSRDAREGAREARRDTREERRELRAADLGLWFNRRAGASGLVVADVSAEGAIAKAGFKEGDKIVSINDQPVATEAQFMQFLRADESLDKQVKVIVKRDNRDETIHVQPSALLREIAVSDPLWRQGILIDDRDPNRVVVRRVFPRTPAYYAGLREGDVITQMRGQRIAKIADLVQGLMGAQGNVAFEVNRGNRTRALEIDTDEDTGETRITLRPNVDSEQRPAAPSGTNKSLSLWERVAEGRVRVPGKCI